MIGGEIEGMVPMTVAADGTMVMEEDGVKLTFAKADAVSAEPEAPATDTEYTEYTENTEDTEAPAADIAAMLDDRMEIKYICTSAEVEGMTLQPSMLGGEYSLTFHANGTVDFVMVGMKIVDLPWTLSDSAIIINYYGTIMDATLTEEGFDLNYFDTMLLHLLPDAEA